MDCSTFGILKTLPTSTLTHPPDNGLHRLCPGVKSRLWGILVSLFLLLPGTAQTEEIAIIQADSPGDVEVGLWLNGLHDVDFLSGSFKAIFYIWWISDDPHFKPFDSLQVLNGRDWHENAVNTQQLPNGRHYTAGFLSTTVTHDWDLKYYPFDRQHLEIVIETPYTTEQLRFEPQNDRSVVSEFAVVEGFRIEDLTLDTRTETYNTDFGLDDAAGTRFSRLSIQVELVRESGRLVLAILVGFAVANVVALLTFAIDKSLLSIRAAMVGGAIFASIGNMYLLNSQMHPALGSMIIDRVAIGTFSVILAALVSGILIDALLRHGNGVLADRLNLAIAAVVSLSAIAFYAATFQTALQA